GPCGARSLRSLRSSDAPRPRASLGEASLGFAPTPHRCGAARPARARAASAARPRPRAPLGEASLGFAPTPHRCGAARPARARAGRAPRPARAADPARPWARRRRALRRAGRRPRDADPQPALARPRPADRRAPLRPARGPGTRSLLAAASGVLLAAAFPARDLEPLAWIGLVPLLVAARGLRPGAAFRVGWLGGFVFYLATVYWVAYTITNYTAVPFVVAVGILALMASVLACYTAAFVAGVRWLEARGLPALWLAPLLWVALEWLRGWFFIGFPWAALGYSQYRHHDLVQIAEVTGVYGVSAILVLFNMVIAGLQG